MKFIFYSPAIGPPWDYSNLESGIGGSEAFHLEMAVRLATRGHEVVSYNNLSPDGIDGTVCGDTEHGVHWHGVDWRDLEQTNYRHDGIHIIQRYPDFIDRFPSHQPLAAGHRACWHVYHDVNYPNATVERMARYDRLIALSPFHGEFLRNEGHKNVTVASGGIAVDRICDAETRRSGDTAIVRNPKRLIYASSPERGLLPLLRAFERASEHVPDLELHIYYGWESYDRHAAQDFTGYRKREKEEMIRRIQADERISWHGRVTRTELWTAFLQSGIWVYQTEYPEVCCVAAMEAQALGAIPIFSPVWALRDNVFAGIPIEGPAWSNDLTKLRFAYEIVRLASSPHVQEAIRPLMIERARARFNWERVVDQFEQMAAEDLGDTATRRHGDAENSCGGQSTANGKAHNLPAGGSIPPPATSTNTDDEACVYSRANGDPASGDSPAPAPVSGKVHLAKFLVKIGLAESVSDATCKIMNGEVEVNGQITRDPILSDELADAPQWTIRVGKEWRTVTARNGHLTAEGIASKEELQGRSGPFGDALPKDVFPRRPDGTIFGGWFGDENKRNLERLIAKHQVRTVAEIGSFLGYSSAWFARRLEKVYCIDKWRAYAESSDDRDLLAICERLHIPLDFYEMWKRNMEAEGVFHKITPLRGYSVSAAHLLREADLIYIDGDHSMPGCMSDIMNYLPKAKKVICGDDYTNDFPGVKRAVSELLPAHQHDGPFWWFETTPPAIGDGCDVTAVRREAAEVVGV